MEVIMANLSTRKKVFICNMVISFLCLVSILGYFIMPFWKVEVSYTLTADTMKEMLLDVTEDSDVGVGEGESEVGTDDIVDDVNFAEILGEDGLTLALSIRLETADVLSSLTKDPQVVVEKIISGNVEKLVAQLNETIDKVAKAIVSLATKTVLKEALKEQVKQNLGENATNEQVQAELDAMGLDDTYISQQSDRLVDAVYTEGATTDSVAEETVRIVEESLVKMNQHDSDKYPTASLTPEEREDLKSEISDVLVEFTDENGNIDINGFASAMLTETLGDSEDSDDGDKDAVEGMRAIAPMSAEEDSEEVAGDLKTALTNSLMEALSDATETIALVLKVLSGVILFSFFTWFYLIIKILAKLRMKNNAIKLKLPIWLGSIPFTVLHLAPTVAMMVLKNNMSSIMGEDAGEAATLMNGLSISFFSCAWLSFVIGVAFFFFAIFYYGKLRKKLKKMKKGLIPDDSIVVESGAAVGAISFDSDDVAVSEAEVAEFDNVETEVATEIENVDVPAVDSIKADFEAVETPEISVDESDSDLS